LLPTLRNEALITSETFKPTNLTGFKNLSGLVSGIIKFPFLSLDGEQKKDFVNRFIAKKEKNQCWL